MAPPVAPFLSLGPHFLGSQAVLSPLVPPTGALVLSALCLPSPLACQGLRHSRSERRVDRRSLNFGELTDPPTGV